MVEKCGKWFMFVILPRHDLCLFQTLMYGKGDKATAEGNELLRSEVEKLRGELKGSEEGKEETHNHFVTD
jgi:hypothetical protein